MSITRFASMFRQQYPNAIHIARTHARFMVTSTTLQSPSKHSVILDNQTLYVDQSLAEALGWKPDQGSDAGIELSLSGWGPTYFTTGSIVIILQYYTVVRTICFCNTPCRYKT